jgi:hypothetical protein
MVFSLRKTSAYEADSIACGTRRGTLSAKAGKFAPLVTAELAQRERC